MRAVNNFVRGRLEEKIMVNMPEPSADARGAHIRVAIRVKQCPRGGLAEPREIVARVLVDELVAVQGTQARLSSGTNVRSAQIRIEK
jgi:hypothetical protein